MTTITDKLFTPVHIYIPNQKGLQLPGFADTTVVYKLQKLPRKDFRASKKEAYIVKSKQTHFGSEQGTTQFK